MVHGCRHTTILPYLGRKSCAIVEVCVYPALLDNYKLGGASRPLARSARSPELATLATITYFLLSCIKIGTRSAHARSTLCPHMAHCHTRQRQRSGLGATLCPRSVHAPTLGLLGTRLAHALAAQRTLGPRAAHTWAPLCPRLATALCPRSARARRHRMRDKADSVGIR